MSRLKLIVSGLAGLFVASLLAAQTPPPAAPKVAPPVPPLEAENIWHLDLSTGGRVSIQLRPDVAPNHVERIKTLTRQGFYNGLAFFRVIEGFMGQSGDPENNGAGGSQLPNLDREIGGLLHLRGAVGMARTEDPNTANSQFYIMFVPRLNMDQHYTVFGRVVSGMNYVETLARGEPPLAPSRIVRASIGADNIPAMSAEALRAEAERLAAQQAAAPPAPPAIVNMRTPPPAPTQAPPPPQPR